MNEPRGVFVVDDDRDLCWVLSRVLADAGYKVTVALDGAKARQQAPGASIDVALIDYRLPDTDGIRLFKSLWGDDRPLQAVLMTSYPTDAVIEAARSAGFALTLTKPFPHVDLLRIIAELISRGAHTGRDSLDAVNSVSHDLSSTLMLQGILHDLGNPLHSAISTLEYLNQKLRDASSPHLDLVSAVLRSLERADNMLRGFSSLRSGESTRESSVDLNAVVFESLKLVQADCTAHGIVLRCSLQKDLAPARGDSDEVARLLLNLLLNSMQAIGRDGSIHITTTTETEAAGRSLVLGVADSGPGFPPELKAGLQSPFVSSKGKGRGLGLFLCREIARAHGGHLLLSDRPEGGAMAMVHFPVQTARV